MSYTNVPSDIIENEIEILPNTNYSDEYQALSTNFFNSDIDYNDVSSIVSRSTSRANEVHSKVKNNAVASSGTNVEKLCVNDSKDVIIGTVYNAPVIIDYLVVGGNDFKDKFNIQCSDNTDPVKTTKQTSKASFRNKIYRKWNRIANVVLLTIIIAGCYLYFQEDKLLTSGPTTTAKVNATDNQYYYTKTTVTDGDYEFIDRKKYGAVSPNHTKTTVTDGDYEFIDRKKYGAVSPKTVREPLSLPVKRIIIIHTATPTCKDYSKCAARVRQIQNYHMNAFGHDDIAYNFLVGGDGRVYEGCGYAVGSHTKNNNKDSIGIAFIGHFTSVTAEEKQLKTAQRLIEDGVKNKRIHPDYALYGHMQLQKTESPGTMLYHQIMSWPHWSKEIVPL